VLTEESDAAIIVWRINATEGESIGPFSSLFLAPLDGKSTRGDDATRRAKPEPQPS
jgi:hypothetical protein